MNIKPKVIEEIEDYIKMDLKRDNVGNGVVIVDGWNSYSILRNYEFMLLYGTGTVASYVFQMDKKDIERDFSDFLEEMAIEEFYCQEARYLKDYTAHEQMRIIAWCSRKLEEIKLKYQPRSEEK